MTEIEELKARIESLEMQSKGMEVALSHLAVAICASGHIDIRKVESSFRDIVDATKSVFHPEDNADFYVPVDRVIGMLDTAVKTVEKSNRER